MKLTGNKIFSFMLAAAFALTLAGCGGGGGGTAAAPDPEPTPMPSPQEMCEADGGRYNADGSCTSAADLAEEMALSGAQEAAMAAYMAAMAAVNGAKDPVAATNAQMYAAMAMEASDAAAMATTSEMAMEYQMKAEMNRDMAMEAAGMRGLGVTMLANKMLNGDDIENAELAGTTPPKAVSNATNVGAAIGAATAAATADADLTIDAATVAGSMTNQGGKSGGTDNADAQLTIGTVDATNVATHKASGSTFAVNIGTARALMGETPSRFQTRGGWEAQDLLLVDGTDDTLKSHLVISTDIQGDKVTPSYGTAVTLAAGTGTMTGDIPGDGSSFEGTYDVTANTPPIPGRYHCPLAGNACSISANADGDIIAVVGYVFEPLVSGTGTKTSDADYLAWGFWVQGSTRDSIPAATTDIEAQAGAFAYGNDRFNVMATLKGSATYNGVASGLYSAAGMVEYFDADVSLTANFGGTSGADSTPATSNAGENDGLLLGVVTGTVSNIMAGGMSVDGSLTLKKADIETTTANGASDDGFTGSAEGTVGGALLMGTWGGQFYGPNKATTAKAQESEYPTTAAGTFGVTGGGHTPMSLLGSFGAWKAE